jgi:uncharacterized protein (TIGR03067 family)
LGAITLTFHGDKVTVTTTRSNQSLTVPLKINPTTRLKEIDLPLRRTYILNGGRLSLGIYAFEGESLVVCQYTTGTKRPTAFSAARGTRNYLYTWKRIKK